MNYIAVKPVKSYGIAIVLVIFFGPFGLFYANVIGGLVMTFLIPILYLAILYLKSNSAGIGAIFLLMIISIPILYLLSLIWAIVGVRGYNRKIIRNSSFISAPTTQDILETVATQPNNEMVEWLKANPGKGINDYFSQKNK